MKAPFKLVAGALILAGLAAAVAVVVMAGRPLPELDLGVAATLVVGGSLLWALANAINLLRLVREELRRQRNPEAPPWLREAPAPAAAAAAAPAAAAAAPAAAEAAPASAGPVPPEVLREQLGEQPMTAEAQRPEPEPAEAAAAMPEGPERDIAAAEDVTPEPAAPEPEPEPESAPGSAEDPAEPPQHPPAPEPAEPAAAKLAAELDEAEEPAPEPVDEAALYVVEERMFRGKPARVLSDGTIEAETDEGWMRFEDFDHLREYMDAAAATRAGR